MGQELIAAPAPAKADLRTELEIFNSLNDFNNQCLGIGNSYGPGTQVSQTDTMMLNLRWYLVSNNRQLLSQSYVEHGIVQTLIDQPVDDAFGQGFSISTDQLEPQEIEELFQEMEGLGAITGLIEACKWARLYGGGAVLLITEQNPREPLNVEDFSEDSLIEFRGVDLWELYGDQLNTGLTQSLTVRDESENMYSYYGHPVHASRVLRIEGRKAPSFIRPRLRGWGMSELERLVRSLNSYLKNQDLIFELLDEAKVDVYGITGFNSAMLQKDSTNATAKRIQLANMLKNFQSALVMDATDTYEQKQITFAGLAEMLLQIRQGVAADMKMPMTKIFGISAAGFNSGEDDLENYNSMVNSEVRAKVKRHAVELAKICCQKKYGFIPDDLTITWPPLRVMSAEQEEKIKNDKFNRVLSTYTSGLMADKEAKQSINTDGLVAVELDENAAALPPLGIDVLTPKDKVENPK